MVLSPGLTWPWCLELALFVFSQQTVRTQISFWFSRKLDSCQILNLDNRQVLCPSFFLESFRDIFHKHHRNRNEPAASEHSDSLVCIFLRDKPLQVGEKTSHADVFRLKTVWKIPCRAISINGLCPGPCYFNFVKESKVSFVLLQSLIMVGEW